MAVEMSPIVEGIGWFLTVAPTIAVTAMIHKANKKGRIERTPDPQPRSQRPSRRTPATS